MWLQSSLLDLFGSFDVDDDGVVDFEEWKSLWAHLGGEDAMAASAGTTQREEHTDDPVSLPAQSVFLLVIHAKWTHFRSI